jgi:TetR/AcrR family transcriptional regulator, transcriptional repressor for nem operon
MPRHRDFSENEVVELAASAFSAHGFNGTSMNLLADATGLGKQSLYNAFGDKQALYLQSIDCAVAKFSQMCHAMHTKQTGYEAIEEFFNTLVLACNHPDPSIHQCIVTSGLLESVDDANIRLTLQKKWQASHEALRSTIERGQRDGSIATTHTSSHLADVLMSMVSGLRVSARVDSSAARMKRSVQVLLGCLKN